MEFSASCDKNFWRSVRELCWELLQLAAGLVGRPSSATSIIHEFPATAISRLSAILFALPSQMKMSKSTGHFATAKLTAFAK